jgi:hypothetical protein
VALDPQPPTQEIQHVIGAPTNQVVATIDRIALALGVPTALAEAQAQVESGFNPFARGDYVNGVPTSFGIYQLHRGGMLGSLTPEQAFNPDTNARVSLSSLAGVLKAHPEYSPGRAAAESQRPADKVGYAAKINAILAKGTTTGPAPAGSVGTPVPIRYDLPDLPDLPGRLPNLPNLPSVPSNPGEALGDAGKATFDVGKALLTWLAKPLEMVALVGLGLIIIVIGLVVLAKAAGSSLEVKPGPAGSTGKRGAVEEAAAAG